MTFALPPIASAGDAADLSAAVVTAVSNGDISISEAAEIGKLIDSCVKTYQAAELNDRVPRIEQMSDEELLRILARGNRESADQLAPKLSLLNPQ